jgi:hypothetical protein
MGSASVMRCLVVCGRRIDALVLQKSFDDREVAVPSSNSDCAVVVERRIDALVLQHSVNESEMAELSSVYDGVVVAGRRIKASIFLSRIASRTKR